METAPEPRVSRKARRFTRVTGSMSQSQGGTVLLQRFYASDILGTLGKNIPGVFFCAPNRKEKPA